MPGTGIPALRPPSCRSFHRAHRLPLCAKADGGIDGEHRSDCGGLPKDHIDLPQLGVGD
jgi:hypothetical protein